MQRRSRPDARSETEHASDVVHVQGKVHMIVGAGGNIVVQAGDEGVLVIDTGTEAARRRVARGHSTHLRQADPPRHQHARARRSHRRQRDDSPRVGESLGGNAPGNSGLALATARVLAHENVLTRMSAPSGQPSPRPFGAWPTETFFSEDKELFFNDEAIQLIHQPGHTDGDVLVFFRRSDVVASGDLFPTTTYPVDRRRSAAAACKASSTG